MVTKLFSESPISMCEEQGWAPDGSCAIAHRYMEVDVRGDAWVNLSFNANHGCIRYQPNAPDQRGA
jgi:hypothetical protein